MNWSPEPPPLKPHVYRLTKLNPTHPRPPARPVAAREIPHDTWHWRLLNRAVRLAHLARTPVRGPLEQEAPQNQARNHQKEGEHKQPSPEVH